jgi:Flp pilus assembly pilin Flp
MKLARRLLRSESGTSTVEFALVIPIVILVMLAAFDFTRVLIAYSTINSGSREGVRYAVLHPNKSPLDIQKAVRARTGLAVNLSVGWNYRDDAAGAPPNPWPPPERRPPRDVIVRVTVAYPWAATSAIAAGFLGAATSQPLVSTSFMDMRR